jgi:hypothetical protein
MICGQQNDTLKNIYLAILRTLQLPSKMKKINQNYTSLLDTVIIPVNGIDEYE